MTFSKMFSKKTTPQLLRRVILDVLDSSTYIRSNEELAAKLVRELIDAEVKL